MVHIGRAGGHFEMVRFAVDVSDVGVVERFSWEFAAAGSFGDAWVGAVASGREDHPKSDSHAYKVNGIGIKPGTVQDPVISASACGVPADRRELVGPGARRTPADHLSATPTCCGRASAAIRHTDAGPGRGTMSERGPGKPDSSVASDSTDCPPHRAVGN